VSDVPVEYTLEVHEHARRLAPTGVLNAEGEMVYREEKREPIGFLLRRREREKND